MATLMSLEDHGFEPHNYCPHCSNFHTPLWEWNGVANHMITLLVPESGMVYWSYWAACFYNIIWCQPYNSILLAIGHKKIILHAPRIIMLTYGCWTPWTSIATRFRNSRTFILIIKLMYFSNGLGVIKYNTTHRAVLSKYACTLPQFFYRMQVLLKRIS